MELNADFSQKVMVDAAHLPWQASPMKGVDRRMLDRIGGDFRAELVALTVGMAMLHARTREEAGEGIWIVIATGTIPL